MEYQFTITIEERHVKSALNHFFSRTMGYGTLVTLGLIFLFTTGMVYFNNHRTLGFALDGFFLAALGFFLICYFMQRRTKLGLLKKLQPPEVHYELTEDTISTRTSQGKVEVKWDAFKGLWMFSDVWLIILADYGGYITLPTDQLSSEVKSFLQQKILSGRKSTK
jgi:hypothetical protein